MSEKVTEKRSESAEEGSENIAERGRVDAPGAERGGVDAPAAERGGVDAPGAERGRRKVREGYVVGDKMDKTVVVAVEDRVKHRLYGKVIRHTSRLKAHDEQNSAAVGDRVRVMETRPISATKRWRLVEIVEKAK
jgi:small subunit ribosomal protein S17